MGRFLNFALGAIMGMAKIAGERNSDSPNVKLKQNKWTDADEERYQEYNRRFDYNYKYSSPKHESTLEWAICPKCGRTFDKNVKKCSYCNYKFK